MIGPCRYMVLNPSQAVNSHHSVLLSKRALDPVLQIDFVSSFLIPPPRTPLGIAYHSAMDSKECMQSLSSNPSNPYGRWFTVIVPTL